MASSRPCISRVGGHPAGVILRGPEVLLPLGLHSYRSSLLQDPYCRQENSQGVRAEGPLEMSQPVVPSQTHAKAAAGSQEQF